MRATRPTQPLGFSRALRLATALVTMVQLLIVAAAPLAERPESTVAAVHVEEAGTSTHHAHGELCAVCAASHLVATPARVAAAPFFANVAGRMKAVRGLPASPAERLDTQPRAPPA
jgi:hypothetical protein